ncbi:hypothetical protein DL93DRAFT_2084074 [Clavulina sp. PMI_390]|nr:hypothetical protein DL93DRAFT_2084074 [Clavulina sp. PMI_390]
MYPLHYHNHNQHQHPELCIPPTNPSPPAEPVPLTPRRGRKSSGDKSGGNSDKEAYDEHGIGPARHNRQERRRQRPTPLSAKPVYNRQHSGQAPFKAQSYATTGSSIRKPRTGTSHYCVYDLHLCLNPIRILRLFPRSIVVDVPKTAADPRAVKSAPSVEFESFSFSKDKRPSGATSDANRRAAQAKRMIEEVADEDGPAARPYKFNLGNKFPPQKSFSSLTSCNSFTSFTSLATSASLISNATSLTSIFDTLVTPTQTTFPANVSSIPGDADVQYARLLSECEAAEAEAAAAVDKSKRTQDAFNRFLHRKAHQVKELAARTKHEDRRTTRSSSQAARSGSGFTSQTRETYTTAARSAHGADKHQRSKVEVAAKKARQDAERLERARRASQRRELDHKTTKLQREADDARAESLAREQSAANKRAALQASRAERIRQFDQRVEEAGLDHDRAQAQAEMAALVQERAQLVEEQTRLAEDRARIESEVAAWIQAAQQANAAFEATKKAELEHVYGELAAADAARIAELEGQVLDYYARAEQEMSQRLSQERATFETKVQEAVDAELRRRQVQEEHERRERDAMAREESQRMAFEEAERTRREQAEAQWREHMAGQQQQQQAAAEERARREAEERAREEERARQQQEYQQRQQARQRQYRRRRDSAEVLAKARSRFESAFELLAANPAVHRDSWSEYVERWHGMLTSKSGTIVPLREFPWPCRPRGSFTLDDEEIIYLPDLISPQQIAQFYSVGGTHSLKRASLHFHPDKITRVLHRVAPEHREWFVEASTAIQRKINLAMVL